VFTEEDLIRKFRSIEQLIIGASTEGEKGAAFDALERIKKRLSEIKKSDPPIEYKFTLTNTWSRKLLSALLRRYDIKPYRYYRQRHTTVMAKISVGFVNSIFWPEFKRLDTILQEHIDEITSNIISKAVNKDTSEATVKKENILS